MNGRFKIVLPRGTQAQWGNARVLAKGEPGVEIESRRWKVGDGVSDFANLPDQGEWPTWDGDMPVMVFMPAIRS